jgi:hypothetical protein
MTTTSIGLYLPKSQIVTALKSSLDTMLFNKKYVG